MRLNVWVLFRIQVWQSERVEASPGSLDQTGRTTQRFLSHKVFQEVLPWESSKMLKGLEDRLRSRLWHIEVCSLSWKALNQLTVVIWKLPVHISLNLMKKDFNALCLGWGVVVRQWFNLFPGSNGFTHWAPLSDGCGWTFSSMAFKLLNSWTVIQIHYSQRWNQAAPAGQTVAPEGPLVILFVS